MLRRDQPKENTMLIRSHHSGFIHPHSSEITPQPLYLRRREFLQWTAAGSMAAAAGTALAQSGPQAALPRATCEARDRLPQEPYPNRCDGTYQPQCLVAQRLS
jgi:hypothetical protein